MNKIIKISEITGSVPTGATFAKLNPSKSFIEKFYKINEYGIPCYWGEQGGWHGSTSYTNEIAISQSENFLKIDYSVSELESTKKINKLKFSAIKAGGYNLDKDNILKACKEHFELFGKDLTPKRLK